MSKRNAIRKGELRNTLCELLKGKGISVHKIIIFGSFIRGDFKEESDIDIIIVSSDFRNKGIFERVKLSAGIGRELVKRFKKPFDLIYYSDEEWEGKSFLIINEAKQYGEVIYG